LIDLGFGNDEVGTATGALAYSLIRPARADDLAAVRALLVETWHDSYDSILGAARVTMVTDDWHSLTRLGHETQREAHAFLVGVVDGNIEGTASATLTGNETLTLNRLDVRPACQRRGLGSALLGACLAQFPQALRIRLEVEAQNIKGRAFYARHGFAETGRRSDCAGVCNAIICEKEIDANRRAGAYLIVRAVRDSDAQDLFGLMTLCFADYTGCYVDPHDDLADLNAPAAAIAKRGGRFWVVEDDEGRVGACASIDLPSRGLAELHRVYVRPDLRRRGLARMLVAMAEDEATARAASRIFFWSDTRFVTAHRLYQRLGYRATGEERSLGDISQSREYRFEKSL
jgi:ribosomal protein S18 acetylase RimI-like enzyme